MKRSIGLHRSVAALLLGACLVGCSTLGGADIAGGGLSSPGGRADLTGSGLSLPQDEFSSGDPLSVAFDTGSFDRYVWRGLILTDGPVFQSSVTVSRGPLSVNVWGNMDLDDANNNQAEFNEIDVTLAYAKTYGPCDLSASVINYNFPNTAAGATTELHVGVAFDVPAEPTVAMYYDVDQAQGAYVTLDVGHSFSSEYANPMAWELALGTGIGLGSADYNGLYYGASTASATDFHVGLAFAVKIHDKWTVSQNVIYTTIVGADFRAVIADDDTVAYGMVLTVEF